MGERLVRVDILCTNRPSGQQGGLLPFRREMSIKGESAMPRHVCRACLLVLLSLAFLRPAAADLTPAAQQELENAKNAAREALQKGPQDIKLVDQAMLKLPEGFGFIPNPAADRFMKALGNLSDPDRVGLVVPLQDDKGWLIDVEYIKSGYIKDDDAKDWDVDELFGNIKQGTLEGNKQRASMGFPEIDIVGWVQKPQYASASHQLIWSIESRDKGAPAGSPETINYNTYVLGREGYISMDLITDLTAIKGDAGSVQTLLDALNFNAGKRYGDFDSSTDKVAEYGLAALVGGVALKKLGLFALAAAFFVKMWKLIAIAVFGASAGWRKYFKNKKAALAPPPGGNVGP